MAAVTCPSAEELRRCASGLADETDAERVLAHVETCPSCQALADALLRAGDSLLGAPGPGAAPRSASPDPALAEALRRMAAPGVETWPPAPQTGDAPAELPDVPGYEVLAEHGRGGMGVVYRARQRALNRPVALKMVLAAELASPGQVLRFRLEAEMAARVRHPNIVQVYEVGEWRGRPFLALEWVGGGNLAQHLAGRPQPPREAARLVEVLARAVQAAHAQGVIHRDLKPANVLLADDGSPRVTDFGLAKPADGGAGLTQTGAVVGTPEYMAPEQVAGQKGVGTAADGYALGAILYEMLTGRPPFRAATPLETLRQVAEQEPPAPRSLQGRLPRDLETICLKCLHKDPARRYRSAAALADDLARFLNGEPIAARRVSDLERAWLWARRRPAVAALLLAVGAALLGGIAVSTYFERHATSRAEQAEWAEKAATAARTAAEEERRKSDRQAAELLFDRAAQFADHGEPGPALLLWLECLRAAPADAGDLRRAARANLAAWEPLAHRLRLALRAPVPYYVRATISPDGTLLAASSTGGQVWRWDAATGRLLGPPIQTGSPNWFICSLAFSPDGRTLLTSGQAGTAQRWDARTGEPIGPPLAPARGSGPSMVAYSPDGTTFATTAGEEVGLYETATGRLLTDPIRAAAPVLCVAFSPDGRRLVVGLLGRGPGAGAARVWDRARNDWVGPPLAHPGPVVGATFTPEGKQVLTACRDGAVRCWDAHTGQPVGNPLWHPGPVEGVAVTPDGSALVTSCTDSLVRFWDAVTGTPAGPPVRGRNGFALDGSGRLLLTGTGELWELGRGPSRPVPAAPVGGSTRLPRPVPAVNVALSPDARLIALKGPDGAVRVAEVATGRPVGPPLRLLYPDVSAQAFSPDGGRLLTVCSPPGVAGALRLWDVATGAPLTPWLPQRDPSPAVAFAPDGKLFVAGDCSDGARLWEATAASRPAPRLGRPDTVLRLALSPDLRRLAVCTAGDGRDDPPPRTRLWDVTTHRPVGEPLPYPGLVTAFFRPDGRALLCAFASGTRLVDAETGAALGAPLPHGRGFAAAAFSPDSKTLVTGDVDGTLCLWDGGSGRPLPLPPMSYGQEVSAVAFSPHGTALAAGYMDGTARLWDAATARPLGPPVVLRRRIDRVAFSPDGRTFVIAARDGTARACPVPAPDETPLEALAACVQARTRLALGAGQVSGPLDDETWEERRRQAGAAAPAAAVTEAYWHDARARDAEEDGNPAGARWHLERLAALRPDDWLVPARLGAALTGAGDLEAARAAYDRADALGAGAPAGWYRHRAVACGRPGQWEVALWYLDRLAAAGADDWELHARRAEALHALGRPAEGDAEQQRALTACTELAYLVPAAEARGRAGKWQEAANLFARAAGPPYPGAERGHALACLKADDLAGYRAVCERLLAALPAPGPDFDPHHACAVASLCALAAGGMGSWDRPLAVTDQALAGLAAEAQAAPDRQESFRATRHAFLEARGMVLYRAGRPEDAVKCLDEARTALAPGTFHDHVFLAMAYHRLNDEQNARECLDRARTARPKNGGDRFWDDVEVTLLVAEAEGLIRPARQP